MTDDSKIQCLIDRIAEHEKFIASKQNYVKQLDEEITVLEAIRAIQSTTDTRPPFLFDLSQAPALYDVLANPSPRKEGNTGIGLLGWGDN